MQMCYFLYHFRGCGWSRKKVVLWSKDDMAWIASMNDLLNKMFGNDFLSYEWDRGLKRMVMSPECFPTYQYDHALWEQMFPTVFTSVTSFLEQPQIPAAIPGSSPANIPATSPTGPASSLVTSSATSPASGPMNTRTNLSSTSSHTFDTTSSTGLVSSLSRSLTSSPATGPANGSCSPTSSHTVDARVAFDPESSEPFRDLRICAAKNCSRGRLATLKLPPVMQIADDDIQLVVDPGRLSNPLQSPVRPSESTINKAYKLMDEASGEDSDDEDLNTTVKFGNLGVFDSRALNIWMKASRAASIMFRVQEEENWLNSTSTTLTPQQINEIRALLFDSEPQKEILRIGDMIVDAEDLATLAAERYLSGFVIDAACLRYSEEAMSRKSWQRGVPREDLDQIFPSLLLGHYTTPNPLI